MIRLTRLYAFGMVAMLIGLSTAATAGSWRATSIMEVTAIPAGSSLLWLVVNDDQFKGNWKQFKGELKRQYGKLTDDDLAEIEGNYEKFQGKLQERFGEQKEEVNRWTENWFEKHNRRRDNR